MTIFSQPSKVFFPYIEDVPSYLTTDMCYPDGKVDSARKSFPSGHTSMAFAGSTFIALLCYHWLTKWRFSSGFERFDIPGPSIAVAMFFLSYVPAFFTAISRTQVSQLLVNLNISYFISGLSTFRGRCNCRWNSWNNCDVFVFHSILQNEFI